MPTDGYTGKPVDRPSDLLPAPNGQRCERCGAGLVDRCPLCGAPVCCPRCCAEAAEESR